MSKIKSNHIFTSESVSEGHPDKICDQVSDMVLDMCLALDPQSKVACETAVTTNYLMNMGEVGFSASVGQGAWGNIDLEQRVRELIKTIGYDRSEYKFSYQDFVYENRLHEQSEDIGNAVMDGGAGDQGMMFGYATNETSEYLPMPIALSNRLMRELRTIRKSKQLPYLRPDAKCQVSIRYENGTPKEVTTVVLSHQTDDSNKVGLGQVRDDLAKQIESILSSTKLENKRDYHINPGGKFVIGGPHGDAGLTGRKIIVDTYGGVGSHGGGAFSGKDPSKVDRSAAYYARYVAKNIVAAGMATKCEIQVAYAIGEPEPVSINVDTYGTATVPEEAIESLLKKGEVFNFRLNHIINSLELRSPKGWRYQDTAAYGHFGRGTFPWERIDKVGALRHAI